MTNSGERLKAARQKLGLTQDQLAEVIGKNRVTIVRWENGTSEINAKRARQLSEHLDVTPEWLMFGGQIEAPVQQRDAVGQDDVTPEVLRVLGNVKGHVRSTVGFDVTLIQALEWLSTQAKVRDAVFDPEST